MISWMVELIEWTNDYPPAKWLMVSSSVSIQKAFWDHSIDGFTGSLTWTPKQVCETINEKKAIAKSSLSSCAAVLYLEYFVKNAQVGFSALSDFLFENNSRCSPRTCFLRLPLFSSITLWWFKWMSFPSGERARLVLVLLTFDSADRWSHGHWKLRVNIACVLCKPNRNNFVSIRAAKSFFASIVLLKLRLEQFYSFLWVP